MIYIKIKVNGRGFKKMEKRNYPVKKISINTVSGKKIYLNNVLS